MPPSNAQPALFEFTDPSGADAVSSSSPSSLRRSVASSLDSPRFVPPPGWKLISEQIVPPTGKRGRGATAQVNRVLELLDPNARGRTKLTFRYRPLTPWIPARIRAAEQLVCEYFKMFAGFRIADDEVVRLFYDALGDYSEQEISWAIESKWLSLRGDSIEATKYKAQTFTSQVQNFPKRIAYWLERSKKYNSAQQAKQGDQRREFAAKLDEIPLRHAQRLASSSSVPSSPSSSVPPSLRASVPSLDCLSTQHRHAAFEATKKTFQMLSENYARDAQWVLTDGPALRDDIALDWAKKQWPHLFSDSVPSCLSASVPASEPPA